MNHFEAKKQRLSLKKANLWGVIGITRNVAELLHANGRGDNGKTAGPIQPKSLHTIRLCPGSL